jgi:hypothetical protein
MVFGVGAGVVKCGCIGCGCGIGRMWMDADVRYRAISCDAVRERAMPRDRMPFDVHKKEITRAHPISHVARTLAHRADSRISPGGDLLHCPGLNRR